MDATRRADVPPVGEGPRKTARVQVCKRLGFRKGAKAWSGSDDGMMSLDPLNDTAEWGS